MCSVQQVLKNPRLMNPCPVALADLPGQWLHHLAPQVLPQGWALLAGPSGPAVPHSPPLRGKGSWTQAHLCNPVEGG